MDADRPKLIFLISQPRAGSTLLQRMLASHSCIHTGAEPWFMLQPCFALKSEGQWAKYEAGGWAKQARDTFLKEIGGRDLHVRAIREMANVVYGAALGDTGKSCFLDKTPRYYTIIEELREVIPEARTIILLRNPLAVICSIVRTWVQDSWHRLPRYRDDLLKAPRLLNDAIKQHGDRVTVVKYEDLVSNPAGELESLCSTLGFPFEAGMLDYRSVGEDFAFGDPTGVHQHEQASAEHLDRWHDDVRDPQVWRLASDYLDFVDREVPALWEHDAARSRQLLDERKPGRLKLAATRSLEQMLKSSDRVPDVI